VSNVFGERSRVSGPMMHINIGPLTRRRSPRFFVRLSIVLAACAAVAHGCHRGGHGDEDLLIPIIKAVESSPAAASP